MRGVVLAGGLGSRLHPFTLVTNKHLLPVFDRPMVCFPIEAMVRTGIDEVMVVTGTHYAEHFHALLADGYGLGLSRLEFGVQQGEGGIAEALKVAEDFVAGERVCVILGDNLFERSLRAAAERFLTQERGAHVLLKRVDDPWHFGVCRFADGEEGSIREIVEKPADPPSDYAVTGAYFYDEEVFDICRGLRPSSRGELEITDVNNEYIRRGVMTHSVVEGWWTDAGTISGLHGAGTLVARTGANCDGATQRVRTV